MSRSLFVINQRTSLKALRRALARVAGEAVVLSTHRLFPMEREALAGTRYELVEFSDLLGDDDYDACDERACREASGPQAPGRVDRMLFLKSAAAHAKLGRFDDIRHTPGLGVSDAYWRSCGGRRFGPDLRMLAHEFMFRLRLWRATPRSRDHLVVHGDRAVLFLGPISRLAIDPEAGCTIHSLPGEGSLEAARRIFEGPTELATTVHFASAERTKRADVVICSDGYHPPNYPRSYLTEMSGRALMPRDMFDKAWFSLEAGTIRPPFAFLRTEHMRAPATAGIRCIVLALNHGGDWSAPINRSDTDRLVEAFAAAARLHPGVSFRVRPHPTMAHHRHEGVDSIERIVGFVASTGTPNLLVSRRPLAEDLAEGDLFVSEYSNVLLDAFKLGKPGLIANLTGRRNFMQCYGDLGFATANGAAELEAALGDAIADPGDFVRRQGAAVSRYNALLDDFLAAPASVQQCA